MSSRHTLRVAGAAMLGIGALLAANSAHAVIDIDSPGSAVVYAKETLGVAPSAAVPAVDSADTKKYYSAVNNVAATETTAGGVLDFDMKVPVGVSATLGVYIRYDLENMVFGEVLGTNNIRQRETGGTRTASVGSVSSGGEAGGTYVVFALSSTGTVLPVNGIATLALTSLGITGDMPGSITAAVYTSFSDAVRNEGSPLKRKTAENVVKPMSGVMTQITPTKLTADVDTGFTSLLPKPSVVGSEQVVPLGAIRVSVVAGALDAGDSTVAAISDVILIDDVADGDPPGGSVKITGDFSVGTFQAFAGDPICVITGDTATPAASRIAPELNSTKTEATWAALATAAPVSTFVSANASAICMTVPAGNDMAIPESMYMAEVKLNAPTGAVFAPASPVTGKVGEIDRGGTTVHIPYLTTSEKHNNRIVITNRGSRDIDYTITYTTETGTTATPGTDSTGMVMKNSTKVLSMASGNVVTLGGGSTSTRRTAAEVTLSAAPSEVQVATVIVNREDGSTDTVVYMPE